MSYKKGLISVVLPVYNGEKYINSAIDSILNQTLTNFELLVINDGSNDQTLNLLTKYDDHRLRIINNDINLGLIATLNKGLSECVGEYIARMDADDIAEPNRFEVQFRCMEENKKVDVIGSNFQVLNAKTISDYPTSDAQIKLASIFESPMAHPTVMFRAERIKEFQYPNTVLHCEDWLFWRLLINEDRTFENLPDILLKYRIEGQNISISNADSREDRLKEVFKLILSDLFTEFTEEELKHHQSLSTGNKIIDLKGFLNYVKKLERSLNIKYDRALVREKIRNKLNLSFYRTADVSVKKAYKLAAKSRLLDLQKIRYLLSKMFKK